jgi:sarcosine oxidase subunit gamma
VRPLPPAARYVLRGGAAISAAAGGVLGFPVPTTACRAGSRGERAALWLGPDEWLIIAPEGGACELGAALRAALAPLPHSLVDVSHRQSALEVHGEGASRLLAAGCLLDLDAGAFPVGMCTRTMLGKAEIVLWRTGAQVFRIEVWRSFAAYVSEFLAEAARGINSGGFP